MRRKHRRRSKMRWLAQERHGKLPDVALRRAPRWKAFSTRIPPQRKWTEHVSLSSELLPAPVLLDGPFQLLRTARSLFIFSWYDCDLLTVAVLVANQAIEAAFRVLYPELTKPSSLQALIKRAIGDGLLSYEHAEWAHDLREMRNLLSHPLAHASLDLPPTVNLLGSAHEIVPTIMKVVARRDSAATE